MKKTRAFFIGRFQPFHHGHYEVVKRLLSGYNEVIVMIGSAEDSHTKENPFTAGERVQMIRLAFSKTELSRIIIIPVRDLHDHARWVSHVKSYVPEFDVVFSNNELVKDLFKKSEIRVEHIGFVDRGSNEGKYIRKLIKDGDEEWKMHVPKPIVKYLESINGSERLKGLGAS